MIKHKKGELYIYMRS